MKKSKKISASQILREINLCFDVGNLKPTKFAQMQ